MRLRFMKNFKNVFYLILCSICITSCGDCYQHISGRILDKNTKKPIDSVYISNVGNGYGEYSDSTGKFEITATSGGLFGCPAMKVAFNKDGYNLLSEEIDNAGVKTIFLEKTE